ncbi:MAG: hypothetical protein BRC26_03760 [Nanohaloarchaea archaeon QH_8_44_6]|nr:MAG: hypothetical protein BRC26_03760 [Nanohaloarchaea archaeon QH_8_44_6]
MDVERFESDLGEVAVTESHIERKRNDSDDWERIQENFPDQKLVDKVHFSEIKDTKIVHGSVFPNIEFKVGGNWMRMFFHIGDPVEKCHEELQYRLKVYSQTH